MSVLVERSCQKAHQNAVALSPEQAQALMGELNRAWRLVEGHHLCRSYRFEGFQPGLDFVNRVGALAEQESHHPDILLAWGRVEITLFTHSLNGLTEADFILAAKLDIL